VQKYFGKVELVSSPCAHHHGGQADEGECADGGVEERVGEQRDMFDFLNKRTLA